MGNCKGRREPVLRDNTSLAISARVSIKMAPAHVLTSHDTVRARYISELVALYLKTQKDSSEQYLDNSNEMKTDLIP